MIPGGMSPQQINKLMKSMGMKPNSIQSLKVTIECEDKNIVINNPQVVEIEMQGKRTYQISGDVVKEERISEDDLKMVMEQANVGEIEAKKALEVSNGDIAEAIIKLSEEKS